MAGSLYSRERGKSVLQMDRGSTAEGCSQVAVLQPEPRERARAIWAQGKRCWAAGSGVNTVGEPGRPGLGTAKPAAAQVARSCSGWRRKLEAHWRATAGAAAPSPAAATTTARRWLTAPEAS